MSISVVGIAVVAGVVLGGCGWFRDDLPAVTDPSAIPVVDADAYMYEWATSDDPRDLAGWSNAIVIATMTERSRPVDAGDPGGITLFQAFRVDDVLAGTGVEPGGQYAFFVDLVVEGGELSQFDISPIPDSGDQYLLFLRMSEDEAQAGVVNAVGAGSGRIPIIEAGERSLLEPGRFDGLVMPTAVTATSVDDVPTLDDWRAAVGR